MADYKYIGLTAYIKINIENEEKFSVLAEAIDGLQRHVELNLFDKEKYQNLFSSEAFQFLYDNVSVCFPDESELPNNTPESYSQVAVDSVRIKNIEMLRLYVPAVAKDEDKIRHFIYNALKPVLIALFGSDIVCMKSKESIEYEEFQDGKETVLVSVKNQLAVTA